MVNRVDEIGQRHGDFAIPHRATGDDHRDLMLFGSVRQMLVTWLTVPLIMAGVFVGLFVTNLSFTFPALLGLLSLVGILIKNCVIMVEEINLRSDQDGLTRNNLVAACVSRLRPVLLAAGTTIVGMAPLLRDDFFREMAVSIMGGLAFGSVLALVAVPVFYALLFSIQQNTQAPAPSSAPQHANA